MAKKSNKNRNKTLRKLEDAYNKSRDKYIKSLAKEYAVRNQNVPYELRETPNKLFTTLSFKTTFNKGVKRKNNKGKLKRFTGYDAVRVQTESLRRQASPSYQKRLFIANYQKALRAMDFPEEYIEDIVRVLKGIHPEALITKYLTETILPEIKYIYTAQSEEEIDNIYNQIMNIDIGEEDREIEEPDEEEVKRNEEIIRKMYGLDKQNIESNKINQFTKVRTRVKTKKRSRRR